MHLMQSFHFLGVEDDWKVVCRWFFIESHMTIFGMKCDKNENGGRGLDTAALERPRRYMWPTIFTLRTSRWIFIINFLKAGLVINFYHVLKLYPCYVVKCNKNVIKNIIPTLLQGVTDMKGARPCWGGGRKLTKQV